MKSVTFETQLGDVYTFPALDDKYVKLVFDTDTMARWAKLGSITIANHSGAVLVLPFRILASISVDGEERWHSRA